MPRLQAVRVDALGSPPWETPESPAAAFDTAASDVLIVGAGVTGLSCALACAERGRSVLVVDRAAGAGATSRSGGIIVGDTLTGPAPGFEDCAEELREWIDRRAPGELAWTGCWELERDDRLSDRPIDWRDHGVVRVSSTVAGGTLDPSHLLNQLAAEARRLGVRVIFGVAATEYRRDTGGVVAETTGGICRAPVVLLATDAAARPTAGDRWPVRALTVALETAALGQDVAATLGWSGCMPFYTNTLPLLWGRATAGGGMVVGRELIPLPADDATIARELAAAGERLTARVRSLHPAMRDVRVMRVWAGPIARNERGVPEVVPDCEVPGVWWAGGYGGHGLAQAFRLGRIAAHRITSGAA